MAERVGDGRRTAAVELVRRRAQAGGSGGDGLLVERVAIVDIEVESHGRAAVVRGAEHIHLRVLVGEHDPRPLDGDLGVADAAVVADQAAVLDRAERPGVEVECVGGASAAQVGDDSLGDGGGRQ